VSPEPVLLLDHVTADRPSGRGPVRVVDDLALAVSAGEMVALMGPSGSGKTSVIHVASGLLAPIAGEVSLLGEVMAAGDRRGWSRARRRTVGVVHQRLDLLPGLSVLDNVALPLLLDRTPVGRAQTLAREALARVGVLDLAGAVPAELSGGEQQRVAIARAVVGPRRLVLADEATAALDTHGAEAVIELLAGVAGAGAAVLMATHDTRLASWADRVVYLRDGREAVDPDLAGLTGLSGLTDVRP
jgi:putative ABC transport system ATP-binding protein